MRLRDRKEWQFFVVLFRADFAIAISWSAVLLLRGVLPALFLIALGVVVGAVQRGEPLLRPLGGVGVCFVLLQVLSPVHRAPAHASAIAPRHGSTIRPRARACSRLAWGTWKTPSSPVISPWHATSIWRSRALRWRWRWTSSHPA
jgi:hypothetical protein